MALLDGKAVVITGSGRGIGAACVKRAAGLGASVVVNDVDAQPANETVEAIRAAGGKAVACVADITDWEEAGRLIQTCIDAYGKIDGLVNNAGVYSTGRIDEYDPKAAAFMVSVNVMGVLHCAAHAVKPMLAQKSGSIVNVTSGAHLGMERMGVYGATKGAVASMIYTWALELAGSGVRVNGLSPFGATRMQPMDTEEERRRFAVMQRPEANSPVIEFLLSDLSSHVHGQILRMDQEELYLYTHPALFVPPATRDQWSAEAIADAFENEFKDRQVGCGVMAMEHGPVDMQGGFWKRAAES